MTPEPLKGKKCDNDGRYAYNYAVPSKYKNKFRHEDVESAVAGLIKFHEDRIESLIRKIKKTCSPLGESYEEEDIWRDVEMEYKSIMAIEHWLEDAI